MIARLVPQPMLTIVLATVWLLLVNEISAGYAVLGLLIGLSVPWITSSYWPGSTSPRKPLLVIEYHPGRALGNIVVSNITVARLILFRPGDSLRSRFVTVPLDLTLRKPSPFYRDYYDDPGTVSADLSSDGTKPLVHPLLEADDP